MEEFILLFSTKYEGKIATIMAFKTNKWCVNIVQILHVVVGKI